MNVVTRPLRPAAQQPGPEEPGLLESGLEEVWVRFFAEGGDRHEARRLLRTAPSLRAEACCVFGPGEGQRLYPQLAREAAAVVEEPGCVLGVVRGRTEGADLLLVGAWIDPERGYVDADALAWFAEGARLELLPLAGMALPYTDREVTACRVLPVIMDLSPLFRTQVLAEAARVAAAVTWAAPDDAEPVVPPPPAYDAELAGPIREILAGMQMPLTPELIPQRRAAAAGIRLSDAEIRRGGRFELDELTVAGPAGAPEVRLLICRPTWVRGPFPVLYNTHGGGMVAGDHRTRELAGELDRAQALGLAVVAVDYRLAPEHPHPAPVEDCYAGLSWVAAHGAEFDLDPDRIVVSGNSAGGNLAAALALLARDRGGPRLLGQMLQCPMLDDRCDSVSSAQMDRVGLWDGQSNRAGWTALLGERRGTDAVPCYAAPARAADLSGLPPAFIDVGSVEALRDEAVAYATRIWQAGGSCDLHVWAGAFHSFDEWVPQAAISRSAAAARLEWLRRILAADGYTTSELAK